MTAAQYLVEYVKKYGWLSVANIFHDNGYTSQPQTTNGFVGMSPSLEMFFIINKIDFENTPILEKKYLTVLGKAVAPQQAITCCPFSCIQRFDALLFTQSRHYAAEGLASDFPIPTRPKVSDILAMTKDESTGLYPGADKNIELTDHSLVSTIDLYPDQHWGNEDYCGLRIEEAQIFYRNHELFCQRMNEFHGVDDCL